MANDDGGLELNIFSAPVALQPTRKKKRGSGKAWDKKKKCSSPTEQDTPAADEASTTRLTLDVQSVHAPLADADRATVRGGDDFPLSSRTGSTDSRVLAVAGASKSPQQDGQRDSNYHRNTATPARRAHSHSTPSAVNGSAVAAAAAGVTKALNPETSNSPIKKTTSSKSTQKNSNKKEPSHERRRVLEMAGRVLQPPSGKINRNGNATNTATTTAANNAKRPDETTPVGSKKGEKPPAKVSPSSSPGTRSAKRKRSSGPVVANGVMDFTVGNAERDKPRSDKHIRRAAATAAAVAKATAKMDKAGGDKWWDDDDDDHVPAAASKRQPAVAAAPAGGKFDWNYGNGAGARGGVEEDKDGGLPSDIHPNSVRTKAVDMDAEASHAMGILASLLGSSGGGGGAGAESRKVKNGGKSKKRAREEAPTLELPESGTDTVTIAPDDDDDSSPSVVTPASFEKSEETVCNVDEEEKKTATASVLGRSTDTGPKLTNTEAAATSGNGDDQDTTRQPLKQWEDQLGTEAVVTVANASPDIEPAGTELITRKTRGKHERQGAQNSIDSVPLAEHHARPRELSRRAASAPRPSARSGHVMAAGPGATFAALGMPPKMVAHLVEPKGENGGGGMGLMGPTVCQLAAVPVLAAGSNTVVKSETGSGKTLAYLLPLLCDLAAMEPRVKREHGTLAVVLAPTRELSAQILEVILIKFLFFCSLLFFF